MSVFNTNTQSNNAAMQAEVDAFKKASTRDSGISVGQVAGVVGGILGAVYMVGEGADRNAAVVGGILGAVAGWAAGNAIDIMEEIPGASSKILSGAAACSFGASCGALATQLINGMYKIPGI